MQNEPDSDRFPESHADRHTEHHRYTNKLNLQVRKSIKKVVQKFKAYEGKPLLF